MKDYLISKEAIDAMAGLHKTHFLNPNAQRVNKSLGDLCGINGFGFHIIEVEPGHQTTETHMHYYEDECVYILAGNAIATVGDEQFPVKAGDFIGYRAGGAAHNLEAVGTETLRCIVVGGRLAHDVADYPEQQKRLFRNHGLDWNLVNIEDTSHPQAGKKR